MAVYTVQFTPSNDLSCLSIQIHYNLFNQRSHNALLQPSIGFRMTPHCFQVGRQRLEFFSGCRCNLPPPHCLLDPFFDLLDLLQGLIPTTLQFACD